MDKTDIYEHLANIYLDTSRKKKAKANEPRRFKNLFLISIVVIGILSFSVITNNVHQKSPLDSEVAFIILPEVIKINYNFNSIKKEAYSVDLNSLNLSPFKALVFSVRKTDPNDVVYMRVELSNGYKEVSELYIKDIRYRWKSFKIALSDFKRISDWSNMAKISFVVEEWNTKNKHGVVYIDDVKFIR